MSRLPDASDRHDLVEHHAVVRLEYDGTDFCGWARQPRQRSVEGELLRAFARLACTVTYVCCAGRTDAGVHALAQVARVHYRGPVPPERLGGALNGTLDDDVVVVAAIAAPDQFDPRGDAISRAYEYRVLQRRYHAPLRARRVLHHPRGLDIATLDACAEAVLGCHDFTAFTPTRTLHRHFRRTIFESRWVARGDELVYCVRGDAFLRNMVRVLVGTMLATARGERTVDEFCALLAGAPRSRAAATAPAHGLCFVDVQFAGATHGASTMRPAGTQSP